MISGARAVRSMCANTRLGSSGVIVTRESWHRVPTPGHQQARRHPFARSAASLPTCEGCVTSSTGSPRTARAARLASRQEPDCRELADRRGWSVVGV
jgi:hypothetical protein